MQNQSKRKMHPKDEFVGRPIALVDELDGATEENRSWFWDLLGSVFQSPDLDYSQFQQLEAKRTPQEMRRNGLY